MEQAQPKPYPIVLTQLSGVRCVVIGGGEVAVRKVRALLDSGARVRVISPDLHPELIAWRDQDRLVHEARPCTTLPTIPKAAAFTRLGPLCAAT
jgi:siroheme synthase-like protein